MAKMIEFDDYGPPEVLRLVEGPDPEPEAGEVRIRVRGAGIQPFDCATRRGDFRAYQPLELPARLGNEAAGVIDAVAADVVDLAAGDEVIAFTTMLGYADTIIVPAVQAVHKPATMPWTEAGVLTASGQTALTALDELGVKEGDTLLIHAAAGGVGSFAVQLACLRGARVIGTASDRNHEYLRELGAEPVRYGAGLIERIRTLAPEGVSAALDAIGGEALDASIAVAPKERVVTIADWAGAARLGIRRIGTERSRAKLESLTRLYEQGLLRIEVMKSFPLADAAAAHRLVESGHARGKVVLTVP
jgi:enoyl reductase